MTKGGAGIEHERWKRTYTKGAIRGELGWDGYMTDFIGGGVVQMKLHGYKIACSATEIQFLSALERDFLPVDISTHNDSGDFS